MNIFASSENSRSLGNWFRERRFRFFKSRIEHLLESTEKWGPSKPLKILDVGGLESYWENRGWQNNPSIHITMLNLTTVETTHSNIISVAGDATDLKDYANDEFDIVFSNSVIEHLYSFENQKKMASEVLRVGKYHFIQTPNKNFIIEPHYLLPFFQFFPRKLKYNILIHTPLSRGKKWEKGFAKQYLDEIRLLDQKDMIRIFPASKLYKESVIGLIKSFTAHNFQ